MLIQQFIENSFVHGLKHKIGGDKRLKVDIQVQEEAVRWIIEDNGVGLEFTNDLKESRRYQSHASNIIEDRVEWMKKTFFSTMTC